MICSHCASTIARAAASVVNDALLDFSIHEKLMRISRDAVGIVLQMRVDDANQAS